MKNPSLILALAGAAAMTLGTGSMATAAPVSADQGVASYDDAVTGYVTQSQGLSWDEAEKYLDTKAEKQQALDQLAETADVQGAWFDGAELTVVAGDAATAKAAAAKGLKVSHGKGQAELDRVAAKAERLMDRDAGIQSVGTDLASGAVKVRVGDDVKASTLKKLERIADVEVVQGAAQGLSTQADVVPGRIMDLVPGTNCSLGFPGMKNGNNVMLTAGHCVEGYPDIYDANGTHIGKGTHTRFNTGYRSVDMGLMDIDSEDRGVPYVDSRGHSGNYEVRGLSKNAIGTEICKAGNTTGWTCGQIEGYNQTVNYGGTIVSGLAEASVCTEGGDSGGAYIGVGNLAQGMTSGGPIGVDCGWNRGHSAGSYSFYQPAVDAANYYGVTLTTVNNWR
ncbi:S1 family peptidase [Kytococcus sedentarius]|uniref:S1 family peptidase n=1 Tax=Kytococcus sedentarius TaxID=1276 RepID=UPI0035BC897C